MKAFWQVLWKKIYQKRFTLLVWLIVLALFIAIFGANFYKIFKLKQQMRTLNQELAAEEERSAMLDAQFQSVGSRAYIEKIAREKYHLYYPDEMIVTPVYEEEGQSSEGGQ